MGYFHADVVPPLIDYHARLLIDLRLDPTRPEAAFRELYQRSSGGAGPGSG